MNIRIILALCLSGSLLCNSQSIDNSVIATSGDYFEGGGNSLSWTLGELAVETYTSPDVILTQGFQQPFEITIMGIDLNAIVYLEGPYSLGSMMTGLKDEGQIPIDQPFNQAPWFYEGAEHVTTIPEGVVDWILIDMRDASSAAEAYPSNSVETQAAFLLNDGTIVGMDGSSVLTFTSSFGFDPFIVVWHRNHLGILSANPPEKTGGVYHYNFSTDASQVYGGTLGYKLIDADVYGMVSGDGSGDGSIDGTDKTLWTDDAGTKGYKPADFNMDSQVNNTDKNDFLINNTDFSSQVPD